MTRQIANPAGVGDDPRWTAVLTRDRQADGRFCYEVRTTGVYCRPSCGARTPRPENVAFYETAAAAEQAGFRPCRRCRPEQDSPAQRQAALVAELCRQIAAADGPPSLATLARDARLSASHLHRLFRAVTGITPLAYARAQRAARMRAELAGGGSAFQQRVWQALQDIPAGATASYAEIARRIGASAAVRAVAGACTANPLAVAIPCHRVVRSDGGLAGYRRGIERKQALLAREREA